MKKTIIKCPRCGKEWEINAKTAKAGIECPHCHKKLTYDLKTRRKMKYVRYFIMLVISCGFVWAMQSFTKANNYIIVVAVIAAAFLLMRVIDNICQWLGFTLFKLSYMDFDEYKEIMAKLNTRKKKK